MHDRVDRPFDERLRDVAIPAGIAARVAPSALFDDAAIDRLLVCLEIPAGLESRVRQAVVAAPASLLADRGKTAPWPTQPLIDAFPAGRGSSHGVLGASAPVRPVMRPKARFGRSGGQVLGWLASAELLGDTAAVAGALSIVAVMFWVGTAVSRRMAAPGDVNRRVVFENAPRPGPDAVAATVSAPVPAAASTLPAAPRREAVAGGSVAEAGGGGEERGQLSAAAAVGPRPAGGAVAVRAAPVLAEPRGPLHAGAGGVRTVLLPAAGRPVPRVPGFDMAFEMAHGESPFVDPAAAAALATDHPPLTLRTDSFDALTATGRHGDHLQGRRPHRPGPPCVRLEELLAALPPAAGGWEGPGVGLSIDAVRSLRMQAASLLVEVCATAPPLARTGSEAGIDEPLDAMLLLDRSGGPFAEVAWQWLCRGLARVVAQMRSVDRLSLIVCGERARVVALRADADHMTGLLPELAREPVVGAADFDEAFRLAAAVDRREGRVRRVVAVAHAGSLEQCREEGRAAFSAWQADRAAGTAAAASQAVGFVVVDPQPPLHDADGDHAADALTTGWIAADPIAIGRAMMARTFGRPTLVAADCRLDVAFDPARVAAYRLVGHRQTAADALATGRSRPLELHAGETVRVVYEVVRRPGPAKSGAGLVSATLAWTPTELGAAGARSGNTESRTRAVLADTAAAEADQSRASPPGSWGGLPSRHGCELLLAVALGERLGASVHAEPWRQTAAAVAALTARWQARGDVTPQGRVLIECLEQLGLGFEPAGR